MIRKILLATILLIIPVLALGAAEEYQEGVHFSKVDPEQPGADGNRILVQGFFMYSCGHCNDLEPHLEEWLKTKPEDVDFVKIPAVFDRPTVILYAKAFYALNLIDTDAEIHNKIFHAIHVARKRLRTEKDLDAFLEANGVNMDEYREATKSFSVQTNVRQASVQAENYAIRGVPTLIVDGKFMVAGQKHETMIGAMNQLIEQVRKAKASAKEQAGS